MSIKLANSEDAHLFSVGQSITWPHRRWYVRAWLWLMRKIRRPRNVITAIDHETGTITIGSPR